MKPPALSLLRARWATRGAMLLALFPPAIARNVRLATVDRDGLSRSTGALFAGACGGAAGSGTTHTISILLLWHLGIRISTGAARA
jgi:hypothetical protein